MNELWRNIDGYKEMYQVSSFGRVRSYKFGYQKILKQRINNSGRFYVNLCLEGKYKSILTHRLVVIHFLGKSNLTVNHKNGNKLNNNVNNLEWVSFEENIKHAKANNLFCKGSRNGKTKLTNRDIQLIRYKYKLGKSQRIIGKEFGVSHACIFKIVNNISWI